MPNQVMKSTRPSASQPSAPQPIASSSKPSTSVTAALQETNSGLRRTTDVSEQRARKKQRTTSARKDKEDKHVIRMGQVILIICKAVGRDPETGVNIWRNPDDAKITMKEGQGLAINGLRDLLSFSTNWEDDEMDRWFRQLFPDFFKWADSVDPLNPYANPPTYHWQLMIRRGNQLKVSPNQLRDGKETNRYLGSSVHGKTDLRRIYLLSSHRVPKSIYQNGWVNAGLSKPSSPKSDSDRYSTCEESEHESWDESGNDTDAGRKQRSKVAQGKRKAEDISSKNTQHKRDARGEIKPQPQPQSLSRALSVISITDTDEFPATLAPFIPFTGAPTIASTPLSHQSLERNRVSGAPNGERNFYYLVAGATPEERQHLHLLDKTTYCYLGQHHAPNAPNARPTDDAMRFDQLNVALKTIGLSEKNKTAIIKAGVVQSIKALVLTLLESGDPALIRNIRASTLLIPNIRNLAGSGTSRNTDVPPLSQCV
ncbi:hypothetical protein C8R44DRAFT_870818 [Mycena epipterygia]|nr:hypothetical protein C8R44DRAFT_870818 [Mycena epipterygia]